MVHISPPHHIIDRLKRALNATSDSELARLIGVSQQAVSSARKGKMPEAWARIALSRFGISADWLYTGSGAMIFTGEGAGRADRLGDERDTRIGELEAQLEEARNAERRALREANAALKRLLPPLDGGELGGF